VLGVEKDLLRTAMTVKGLNLSKYPDLVGKPLETTTKIRYNDDGSPALIEQFGDEMRVYFHEPVKSIAPGQAAVFYEGEDMLGGGWIQTSFNYSAS
jgi:tRNA-specific 2-thiouridylase